MPQALTTVALLIASNVFMTYAWYYHLKKPAWPLLTAIIVSWLIAFVEYSLMVPANRYGHVSQGGPFTGPQLKIIQEAITLTVFGVFSAVVLREKLQWTDYVGGGLIFAGAFVALFGKDLLARATL
jgi:uncharacterized protein (DUF486 family)